LNGRHFRGIWSDSPRTDDVSQDSQFGSKELAFRQFQFSISGQKTFQYGLQPNQMFINGFRESDNIVKINKA
jgi:hypothetical protein